jgi:AcrR family transcriptional regulator
MPKQVDRRVRKTKQQLRTGLAHLMQEKSIQKITVRELVNEVDINRSTFYLHYTDIQALMDEIKTELLEDITSAIQQDNLGPIENAFPFITDIFMILEKNKEICKALVGPHGDLDFVYDIEEILAEYSIPALQKMMPLDSQDLLYCTSFILSGCVGLIKIWLMEDKDDSPLHMAQLTYQMVINVIHSFQTENE